MRCDEVATLLPGLVDGVDDAEPRGRASRARPACGARPSWSATASSLRNLELLRTRYVEPTPGLLGETLAAITDAAERGAIRTLVTGRRLAYAGAIGGTVVDRRRTALIIARSRRRSSVVRLLAS